MAYNITVESGGEEILTGVAITNAGMHKVLDLVEEYAERLLEVNGRFTTTLAKPANIVKHKLLEEAGTGNAFVTAALIDCFEDDDDADSRFGFGLFDEEDEDEDDLL